MIRPSERVNLSSRFDSKNNPPHFFSHIPAPPDTSTYTYDEASGYYYDAQTTFYYDANTSYYYNSKAGIYVYWSPEHQTYLPVPQKAAENPQKEETELPIEDGNVNTPKEKTEKVKSAKRIAKDMEKWAKTLNQKKDAAKNISPMEVTPAVMNTKSTAAVSASGAQDVAFNMLRGNALSGPSSSLSSSATAATTASTVSMATGLRGLPGYGSEPEDEPGTIQSASRSEPNFTDWEGLACLLCKRQFASKEKLQK